MKPPYIVHYDGHDIECYGELEEDSNFSVVCEDEEDDDIWCESNPIGDSFATWEEVVTGIYSYFGSAILEISAC